MNTNVSFHPSPQDNINMTVNYFHNDDQSLLFITVKLQIGLSEFVLYFNNQKEFERYLDAVHTGFKHVNRLKVST